MNSGFLCKPDVNPATEFCLCDPSAVFLCAACHSKHEDKSLHDIFPMDYHELYQALGSNKVEFIKRVGTVEKCRQFLDNALAREAAVMSQAINLIGELVRQYQGWLEKNHQCFLELVGVCRNEISCLMTAPEVDLSRVSQTLVERIDSLDIQEVNELWSIPEEKSLKEIMQQCKQALKKSPELHKQEYTKKFRHSCMKPAQRVSAPMEPVQVETIEATAQRASAPMQPVHLQTVEAATQRASAPMEPIQAQTVEAPAQRVSAPMQPVQVQTVEATAQRASAPLQPVHLQAVEATTQRASAPMEPIQAQTVEAPVQRVSAPMQPVEAPAQGDEQKLIAVLKNEVKCFDVATSRWQQLFALGQNIDVNEYTASTFIPPNSVFVCGGRGVFSACTIHIVSSAYMLVGDRCVQELPRMSTGRRAPGVIWDSVRHALYVFGGINHGSTCYTAYLRTSEMFTSKWELLPEMNAERRYFNPCWHSCIVYLCGGCTNSVETFDPRSNTFLLLGVLLPEDTSTTAVVENDTLTVISKNYISKLEPSQARFNSQKHVKYSPWSNCAPLVSGGVVYIVDLPKTCRCIELTTGAELKKVSLS